MEINKLFKALVNTCSKNIEYYSVASSSMDIIFYINNNSYLGIRKLVSHSLRVYCKINGGNETNYDNLSPLEYSVLIRKIVELFPKEPDIDLLDETNLN